MRSFKYTAEVPTEDGEGTEEVTFVFKPFRQLPAGLLRRHRGDDQDQMWAFVEWALSAEQLKIFDRIPAIEIGEIIAAWEKTAQDQDKPKIKRAKVEDDEDDED